MSSAAVNLRRCRVCGAAEDAPFFRLQGVPVQDGLLWPTRAAALDAPSGDIELVFCSGCGYIGNRAFDPSRLRYDPTYDISLHYSPVYREFIDGLVDRLAREYRLAGKAVLEIGSGKGDFLQALCARAGARGVGFDPTSTAEDTDPSVRIVKEFYSERWAAEPADLLCCRHVLNSIEDLRGFLG
ncbi:MAG TPA: methyltransferase domain-containing protein, partial [Thermoanaerobaculia bacterium]|nr:methyltransferase domain-containing protein [Thermoanaerobaculia bacterium]